MIPQRPQDYSIDRSVPVAANEIKEGIKEEVKKAKKGNLVDVAEFLAKCLDSMKDVDIGTRLLVQRVYARMDPEDLAVLQAGNTVPLHKRKEALQKLQMAFASDPEFFTFFVASALQDPMKAMGMMVPVLNSKDDRPSDNVSHSTMNNVILLVGQDTPEEWQERMNKAKDINDAKTLPVITIEEFK